MSGICGLVRWSGGAVTSQELDSMLAPVPHRGPDGVGRRTGSGVALGHLAHHVTPESVHEGQPLEDPRLDLVLVADARIDNREELISLLRACGELSPDPTAHSDAHLILAAYRAWGEDCPARLLGDFAFAVWDGQRRQIVLARDPMGLRALHFRAEGDRFLFATEIKQILAVPGVPSDLHLPALAAHLAGGFGLPEWTAFAGTHRLQPGHVLVAREGGVRRTRTWTLDPGEPIRHRSDAEYAEHFLDVFRSSVQARMRTIRPVGLLLSGGVDSGAIAATAGDLRSRGKGGPAPGFRAYSFAWSELAECDERHISGPLAAHLGIPVTDVPADDAWPLRTEGDPEVDHDSPFLFGHYVLLGRACRAAREDGTGLMLSGDRGDLVGGMAIHDLPSLLRTGRWLTLSREIGLLARWSGRTWRGQARREFLRVAREAAVSERLPWWSRLPRFRGIVAPRPLCPPDWLAPQLARELRDDEGQAWLGPTPDLPTAASRERYRMIFTPLHMLGVEASERMHARWGQAFADPWSDRRVAEFACRIPQRVMNRVGEPKRLTRLAMQRLIPPPLATGMRKVVPTPLFDRGLRDREAARVRVLLGDSELARLGMVDGGRLQAAYDRLCREPGQDATLLWQAVSLELWCRTVVSPSGAS